jgi:hypothetical protein
MATRSTIAIEHTDGTVSQVYCHWDGYLDHNGKILLNHYNTPELAAELIRVGDISSLREQIGEQHDFDERYDESDVRSKWTNYYSRDRGESNTQAKKFLTFDEYVRDHQYEEFEYIMRNGEWFVSEYSSSYKSLADVMLHNELDDELEAVDFD